MKKSIAVLLAFCVLLTSAFVACKKETQEEASETGIGDSVEEVGFQDVPVTDENGKEVTDEKGNVVTTEIAVKYQLDKNGKTKAIVINKDGEELTDKKGNPVTVKPDIELTTKPTTQAPKSTKKGETTKTTESTTVPTKKDDQTTQPEVTTKKDMESVPNTNDSGERVTFSSDDQQIIKNMLEVPYLYVASYENADGVPISCAAHAAMWMLERDNISTDSYAAGTVVIDLFKYFGQTVVNFKSKVNEESGAENLIYNAGTDTFVVRHFEAKAQDVTIDHFESFGYGNYYKVVGTVKDAGKYTKVVAIVQKNRLDNSLGFSVKALKWS